jgi:hypothetical protein
LTASVPDFRMGGAATPRDVDVARDRISALLHHLLDARGLGDVGTRELETSSVGRTRVGVHCGFTAAVLRDVGAWEVEA